MKHELLTAAALTLGAGFALAAAQPDAVLDAMQAELKRSMTLTLNQLDKPYYLSYTVDDEHVWSASATLGGLVSSSDNTFRVPNVRIRVGNRGPCDHQRRGDGCIAGECSGVPEDA